MFRYIKIRGFRFSIILLLTACIAHAQENIHWSKDGNAFYTIEQNEIIQYTLPAKERSVLVTRQQLTPLGQASPLKVVLFALAEDQKKILIYTNTQRVWRIHTRGDYWVLGTVDKSLKKLGATLPKASLMFAKFSPDGTQVAYVSDYNIYVENLSSQTIKQLTKDGNRKFINGTFDWVYEEEFSCRDGIRWSADSRYIAFWQLDARGTGDFFMINNTDSVYSRVIPVEYPKVGQSPSACRIGVIDVSTSKTTWMSIDGDPRQHYIVRLEFIPGSAEFLVQQLNRLQNESKIIRCNAVNGKASVVSSEKNAAWVDVLTPNDDSYAVDFKHPIHWLAGGKEFLWTSEKSGWRHLYRISSD
jgi:dipeptidyl-peptidase 4